MLQLRRYFTSIIQFLFLFILFFLLPKTPLLASPSVMAGPFQGHTTSHSMKVWLMVKKAEKVELILSNNKHGTHHSKFIDVDTIRNFNLISPITFKFDDLKADSDYTVTARLDGEATDSLNNFSTLARTQPDSFSFLIGSCAFVPPFYIRPFIPSSPLKAFQTMTEHDDADFMLWTGDYMYYWTKHYETPYYPKYWRHIQKRKKDFVDNFIKTMPQYAIWDDHDFGPNNSDGQYAFKKQSLKVHKQFWANPSYGTDTTPGIFTSFRHHDAAFFLTDGRYHRTPANNGKGSMLGEQQMAWLKEELLASTAPFKFIVFGNQVLNRATDHETHSMYKNEHNELLNFIKQNSISGVVFLSGDRHFTELSKRSNQNFYPFYDFTSSPISSIPNNQKEPNQERIEGTWTNQHNFGKLTISGKGDDRQITISTYSINNKRLWDYTIKLKDITPEVDIR